MSPSSAYRCSAVITEIRAVLGGMKLGGREGYSARFRQEGFEQQVPGGPKSDRREQMWQCSRCLKGTSWWAALSQGQVLPQAISLRSS